MMEGTEPHSPAQREQEAMDRYGSPPYQSSLHAAEVFTYVYVRNYLRRL
jgi:hypothetical protein